MVSPVFDLPVASLFEFLERLRAPEVSFRVRLPEWPGEFECRFRRGFSTATAHGYRLGELLRFDLLGAEPLYQLLVQFILGCGGARSDQDAYLEGWTAIQPSAAASKASAA